jgi:hypothetical protein
MWGVLTAVGGMPGRQLGQGYDTRELRCGAWHAELQGASECSRPRGEGLGKARVGPDAEVAGHGRGVRGHAERATSRSGVDSIRCSPV